MTEFGSRGIIYHGVICEDKKYRAKKNAEKGILNAKRFLMTEDIIKKITTAESEAADIKRAAQENAAKILADAQKNAQGIENSAAETCKTYVTEQIQKSRADAETEYLAAMQKQEKDAKAYCETALQNAETSVQEIVGRVLRGNR